jgi:hypothetical protein
MKQIASAYTYNKTSGVIVLSGSTIDRDQLLLVVNTTRNVTYYNFADSATTLQSYVNPSVYKGFYDGGGMYNIGDIVQTNGNPYGTAGGFFIRLQAPNAGYAPAVGGGSNSHWAPTSASGTTITLNASVVSSASSHNNADALTIYYDDQAGSGVISGTVDSVLKYLDDEIVAQPLADITGTLQAKAMGTAIIDDEPTNKQIKVDEEGVVQVYHPSALIFHPAQGAAVTNTNFTSTIPSTSLVFGNAGRRVLTVFNEGPGLLYISAIGDGTTCTTTSYQVRLGVGDYWEAPAGQLQLNHAAVFGTAGTARVSQGIAFGF